MEIGRDLTEPSSLLQVQEHRKGLTLNLLSLHLLSLAPTSQNKEQRKGGVEG